MDERIKNHDQFIACIHSLTKGRIRYFSKKDNDFTERTIAPVDYGPHARWGNDVLVYHFLDFEGTNQKHPTAKQASEIDFFRPLDEKFAPSDIPHQKAVYSIPRAWG